jgi:hypothetical protein
MRASDAPVLQGSEGGMSECQIGTRTDVSDQQGDFAWRSAHSCGGIGVLSSRSWRVTQRTEMAREGGWRRGVSRSFACRRVGASLDRARFGVPNVLSVVDDGACEDVTVQSSVREKL